MTELAGWLDYKRVNLEDQEKFRKVHIRKMPRKNFLGMG